MSLRTKILKSVVTDLVIPGVIERTLRRQKKAITIAAGSVGLFLAGRAVMRRVSEYDLQHKTVLITGGSLSSLDR